MIGPPGVADSLDMWSVSTANRIAGNLWMGGFPPPTFDLSPHFDCVALCAREYQPQDCFGVPNVVRALIDDSGKSMTREEAAQAVRAAGRVVRALREGQRVLVTCMAGRNRSGLVVALSLCRGAGWDPDRAIGAIREARSADAFRNRDFESFLRAYCSVTPREWVSSREASSR